MRNIKNFSVLCTVLAGLVAITGCGSNANDETPNPPVPPAPTPEVKVPLTVDDFKQLITTIGKDKNYTYKYSSYITDLKSGKRELDYSYEERYTDYGMYGFELFNTLEDYGEFGYAVIKDECVFKVTIDENDSVIPGRAIRKIDGSNLLEYDSEIISLDDLKPTDFNLELYDRKDNYINKSLFSNQLILQVSQVNLNHANQGLKEVTIDLADSKNIGINAIIEFGQGNKQYRQEIEGTLTNVGTTEIPQIKNYLENGNGPFVRTEVVEGFQSVIDDFKSANYKFPLTEFYGGSVFNVVGESRVYSKSYVDKNVTAIYNDYNESNNEESRDHGYIEIEENGSYIFKKFTLENDAEGTGKHLVLGEDVFIKNVKVNNFSEMIPYMQTLIVSPNDYINCYNELKCILPGYLTGLNENKLYFDYNSAPNNEMYDTEDLIVNLEIASFLGIGYTFNFATFFKSGFKRFENEPIFDNGPLSSGIRIMVGFEVSGQPNGASHLAYYDFGKVSMPEVDAFMEAK